MHLVILIIVSAAIIVVTLMVERDITFHGNVIVILEGVLVIKAAVKQANCHY